MPKKQQSKPQRRRNSGGSEYRSRNTSKSASAQSVIGCGVEFCPAPRAAPSFGSNCTVATAPWYDFASKAARRWPWKDSPGAGEQGSRSPWWRAACALRPGMMTAHHARNSFWFAIPCSLLSQNRDRRIRRSPTTAASENTRRLRLAGKPTASRRFERRTHRLHSQFVRAELGYPHPEREI